MKALTGKLGDLTFWIHVISFAAIVGMLLVAANSCSHNSVDPGENEDDTNDFWDRSRDEYEPDDPSLTPGPESTFYGIGWVDDDGGCVGIGDGRFALVVPGGAVDNEVKIRAEVIELKSDGETIILFDLGPDKLDFDRPVYLVFDITILGSNATGIDLYRLNPDSGSWEYQRTAFAEPGNVVLDGIESREDNSGGCYIDSGDFLIVVAIDHLADYGVSEAR
jgi:hypothetical protein